MITKEQALEALDNMDDYARMAIGVNAIGALKVLQEYIEQVSKDAALYQFIRSGGAYIEPNEDSVYMSCGETGKYYKNMEEFDADLLEEVNKETK